MKGEPFTFINIAVKPHIKKYIQYQYRDFNFVCITKRNFIGVKLYDLLLQSKKVRLGGFESAIGCKIGFAVSEHQFLYRTGVSLTENATKEFNQFVEQFFYKDLFDFIEMNHSSQKVKTLIEMFCEKLDVQEDDISYDALIKSHQRHLESINIADELKAKRGEFTFWELRKLKKQHRPSIAA